MDRRPMTGGSCFGSHGTRGHLKNSFVHFCPRVSSPLRTKLDETPYSRGFVRSFVRGRAPWVKKGFVHFRPQFCPPPK